MWEVCQSEFNLTLNEFLFDYTVPQLTMLVQARLERDAAQDKKKDNPNKNNTGTVRDMMEIERAFAP